MAVDTTPHRSYPARLASVFVVVALAILLGASAASAFSHTVGGVYHGIHKNGDHHHGWGEHDHGLKWGEVDQEDFAGDWFMCGWQGDGIHEHCDAYWGGFYQTGRGFFYTGWDFICWGGGAANSFGDGHGHCDHTHTDT